MNARSDSALDFAAPQATGANGHALRRAVYDDPDVLDIRSPDPLRPVVCMADVISGQNAFLAHLTELAHTLHLLRSKLFTANDMISY